MRATRLLQLPTFQRFDATSFRITVTRSIVQFGSVYGLGDTVPGGKGGSAFGPSTISSSNP